MQDVRVRLSTLLIVTAVASAGAFAAGRSTGSAGPTATIAAPTGETARPEPHGDVNGLPPGHPAPTEGNLPPGHPPVDPAMSAAPPGPAGSAPARADTGLTWKVPARWQEMPNTSSMRLATYRIPRAAGDPADADVSVMQAGGTVAANADRWVGQFDAQAQARAKRETKKIAGLDVTLVEVDGAYSGMGTKPEEGMALVGAIVATPDLPHFFKITGPKRTVQAARAELDALLASLKAAH